MGQDMRETAVLHRVKQGYTTGARTLASRSIVGLARTRITPNALTTAGVSLCLAASVLVFFENRNTWLFYWTGAAVFVIGSILDILDGALARAGGKTTPFGAFIDSTTDRIGEGAMLGSIALVFNRHDHPVPLAAADVAPAGRLIVTSAFAAVTTPGLPGVIVNERLLPTGTLVMFAETVTPRSATTAFENSDVSFVGLLVAVAVTSDARRSPGRMMLNAALPPLSVLNVEMPRNCFPSPDPLGSTDGFE